MPVIGKFKTYEQFFPTSFCCTRTLLTEAIIGSDRVFLDHISLSSNSSIELSLELGMIGWAQVLNGFEKLDVFCIIELQIL